jgi:predicted RNA binding protein YcfA (HicA-like mRNA interferase family)
MNEIDSSHRTVVARLRREGWVERAGGRHDIFKHPDRPGVRIVVPRHRTLSKGVARAIADVAGWP